MNLKITLNGHQRLVRNLDRSSPLIKAKVMKFLLNQSTDVNRTAVKEAPVDTANLQTSIRPDVSMGKMKIVVKPTAKYALFAHEGRRAGKMPPVSAVERWSQRKGLDPFLVARSIGRKGTKGKPFMDIAYKKQKPVFRAESRQLLNDIVRAI